MSEIKNIVPELYRDYSDLLKTGKIKTAVDLTKSYSNILGVPFFFSHFGTPHYPTKNFKAKTVFIHLNPGSGLGNTNSLKEFLEQNWDKNNYFREHNLSDNATVDDLVEKYKIEWDFYARKRFGINGEKDNFDFKQACFLLGWPDSGIDLLKGNFKNSQLQTNNTINVIDQKLQLELFPYASNTISTQLIPKVFHKKPELVTPYIEKLLDIITMYPRKYVIFGSRVYDKLFRLYHNHVKNIIEYVSPEQRFENITKNALTFTYFRLKWNNYIVDAGVANSFPRRDLPNAYEKMYSYGKSCFNYFDKIKLQD
jgi:hypothetical protein